MYRHLLVAIDDSPLGMTTASRAVAFARTQNSEITFFYATPDLAATSEGALLHAMDRGRFDDARDGMGSAVLLKAATAAQIAGISCSTHTQVSDRPAQAILEAAHSRGCDLIFVSSHGRQPGLRGWLQGSVTQKLVQIADLPVLVSAVENNMADADASKALGIIAGEHRSIAAVLRGMQHLVRSAREPGARLDTELMRKMADYLRAFPGTQHHPKEEAHLFRLLQSRTPEFDSVLRELERQHHQEPALVQALTNALDHHDSASTGELEEVAETVQRLAGAIWEHMSVEESTIMKAAQRLLSPRDWTEIAMAFEAHDDPLRDGGADLPLDALFNRIARALAAPTVGSLP